MKIMMDKGAVMPTRAHTFDAGLDLYAPDDFVIPGCLSYKLGNTKFSHTTIGCGVIDTGVHIEIPEGYVGLIKSKSGLNVKYGLTGEGVIDSHYTGSIKVKLYNHTENDYSLHRGDKIAQLVIVPCLLPELDIVDSLPDTDRGDNGFGSTGR